MKIQDKYPELSKYIAEMPVKISTAIGPETVICNLKGYYDSLDALLKRYAAGHRNEEVYKQSTFDFTAK